MVLKTGAKVQRKVESRKMKVEKNGKWREKNTFLPFFL